MNKARFSVGLMVIASMALAAGCQTGDVFGGGSNPREVVTQEELLVRCPLVTIRSDGAVKNTYQDRTPEPDATKLIYQASISDATRTCNFNGGVMNLTVALAGRVVSGPLGKPGTVNLPLRVTVVQGSTEVFSQRYDQAVSVADTTAATQFVFNQPGIVVNVPSAAGVGIFVGFDKDSAQAKKPSRRG